MARLARTPTYALLGILALGALLQGCYETPRGSTLPPAVATGEPEAAAALLPPRATRLLFVDLQAVRKAPLYDAIAASLEDWGDVMDRLGPRAPDEPRARSALETLGRSDWVLVAEVPHLPPREAERFVLVGGELGEGKPRELLAALEQRPEQQVPQNVRGPVYAHAGSAVTRLAGGLWVGGTRERVFETRQRAAEARGFERTAPVLSLVRRTGGLKHDALYAVSDVNMTRPASVAGESSELSALQVFERETRSFALHADLDTGLRAQALVETFDAAGARRLGRELQLGPDFERAVRRASLDVFSMHRLGQHTRVRSEGSRVRMTLKLSDQQAHLWWGRVSGLVGYWLYFTAMFERMLDDLQRQLDQLEQAPKAPPKK